MHTYRYRFDKMQGPVVMVVLRENRIEQFKVVKLITARGVAIARPHAESPG